jgi:hypothetical protein
MTGIVALTTDRSKKQFSWVGWVGNNFNKHLYGLWFVEKC